jgi:hypothetical protein
MRIAPAAIRNAFGLRREAYAQNGSRWKYLWIRGSIDFEEFGVKRRRA